MEKFFGWLLGIFRRPKVLISVIGFFVVYSSVKGCFSYVAPDQVAVRQVYFGAASGLQRELVGPGLHFVMRGAQKLHLYPTDIQVMDMTSGKVESSPDHRVTSAIRIQTSEGYAVTVDATVLYRIVNPYLVMTKIGPGKLYEDSVIIPRSDLTLRKTLGELNAEEFYDPAKRMLKVTEATRQLKAELTDKGLELVKVMVRQITYDQAYQSQIERRKIQDQVVFKNQAEAKSAKGDAHKREIVAGGQAGLKVELEKGKSEAARLLADANLYARQKAAEADLLVKQARARGIELENAARNSVGSENLVGLRMAEALRGIKIIVLPSGPGGFNPLDLNSTLRQFEVR